MKHGFVASFSVTLWLVACCAQANPLWKERVIDLEALLKSSCPNVGTPTGSIQASVVEKIIEGGGLADQLKQELVQEAKAIVFSLDLERDKRRKRKNEEWVQKTLEAKVRLDKAVEARSQNVKLESGRVHELYREWIRLKTTQPKPAEDAGWDQIRKSVLNQLDDLYFLGERLNRIIVKGRDCYCRASKEDSKCGSETDSSSSALPSSQTLGYPKAR